MSQESCRKALTPVVVTLTFVAIVLLMSLGTPQKPIDIFYKGTFATAGAGVGCRIPSEMIWKAEAEVGEQMS